jgi:four helix bundle protein
VSSVRVKSGRVTLERINFFCFVYEGFIIKLGYIFKLNLMKESMLKTKSYSFALDSITLYKKLISNNEYIMSKQLVRSATSVGANIREANNAQSLRDFIHKLSISIKECNESQYWLELLVDSNYIDRETFNLLYLKSQEIYKMLASSLITSKAKLKK